MAPRRGHRHERVDARVAAAHHRGQRRVRQERREGAGPRELPQVDVRGDGPAHDVAVDVRRFDGPRRVGEAVEVREGLARGRRDADLDGRRRPRRRQRRDVDAVRPRERPVVGLGDCRVAQQRVERHGALAHDAREGRVARVQEGDGRHGQPRRLEARQAHGAGARAPRRGPVALDDADAVLEELVLERRRILGSGGGRGPPLAAVVRRVHAAAEAAAEAGRGERRRDGVDRAAQRRRHGLEVLVVARRLVQAQGLDAHDEALRGPRVFQRVLDRGLRGLGAGGAAHGDFLVRLLARVCASQAVFVRLWAESRGVGFEGGGCVQRSSALLAQEAGGISTGPGAKLEEVVTGAVRSASTVC